MHEPPPWLATAPMFNIDLSCHREGQLKSPSHPACQSRPSPKQLHQAAKNRNFCQSLAKKLSKRTERLDESQLSLGTAQHLLHSLVVSLHQTQEDEQ